MDPGGISQSPFAVVTFIAAPALLTNASSLLVLSTINRMLRTRERMQGMYQKVEEGKLSPEAEERLVPEVDRTERQAVQLLHALRAVYIALGAFVSSTLVTLLGAGAAIAAGEAWLHVLAGIGIFLGFVGVGGMVAGCLHLLRATVISMVGIQEEAAFIRERSAARRSGK